MLGPSGMTDLLSVLLMVFEDDDLDAFWCFAGLIDRTRACFQKDQSDAARRLADLGHILKVVDVQLYNFFNSRGLLGFHFLHRWLVVLMKREFPAEDVPRLWEALWTCPHRL
eukprot:NODE_5062_length_988_cov_3.353757_g4853_i0.p2 GENE.NODE_5062_length_988_cov_3.353757_g4853_i0~~NODE_5062_length_988_cov_3.353757_g4853_i0.p2  ORF type:complete len:112 (+),score=21.72 NODE_5062_length_988_cov_3.353757_g4853_i0:300-635(+)